MLNKKKRQNEMINKPRCSFQPMRTCEWPCGMLVMSGLFYFFISTDECYLGKLLCCCSNVFFLFCASWSAELWQQNRSLVFQGHGVALQARTMLLDEGHERLYIGAKNALFSLSLDQINTDHREVGLFPAVRKYVANSHTHS